MSSESNNWIVPISTSINQTTFASNLLPSSSCVPQTLQTAFSQPYCYTQITQLEDSSQPALPTISFPKMPVTSPLQLSHSIALSLLHHQQQHQVQHRIPPVTWDDLVRMLTRATPETLHVVSAALSFLSTQMPAEAAATQFPANFIGNSFISNLTSRPPLLALPAPPQLPLCSQPPLHFPSPFSLSNPSNTRDVSVNSTLLNSGNASSNAVMQVSSILPMNLISRFPLQNTVFSPAFEAQNNDDANLKIQNDVTIIDNIALSAASTVSREFTTKNINNVTNNDSNSSSISNSITSSYYALNSNPVLSAPHSLNISMGGSISSISSISAASNATNARQSLPVCASNASTSTSIGDYSSVCVSSFDSGNKINNFIRDLSNPSLSSQLSHQNPSCTSDVSISTRLIDSESTLNSNLIQYDASINPSSVYVTVFNTRNDDDNRKKHDNNNYITDNKLSSTNTALIHSNKDSASNSVSIQVNNSTSSSKDTTASIQTSNVQKKKRRKIKHIDDANCNKSFPATSTATTFAVKSHNDSVDSNLLEKHKFCSDDTATRKRKYQKRKHVKTRSSARIPNTSNADLIFSSMSVSNLLPAKHNSGFVKTTTKKEQNKKTKNITTTTSNITQSSSSNMTTSSSSITSKIQPSLAITSISVSKPLHTSTDLSIYSSSKKTNNSNKVELPTGSPANSRTDINKSSTSSVIPSKADLNREFNLCSQSIRIEPASNYVTSVFTSSFDDSFKSNSLSKSYTYSVITISNPYKQTSNLSSLLSNKISNLKSLEDNIDAVCKHEPTKKIISVHKTDCVTPSTSHLPKIPLSKPTNSNSNYNYQVSAFTTSNSTLELFTNVHHSFSHIYHYISTRSYPSHLKRMTQRSSFRRTCRHFKIIKSKLYHIKKNTNELALVISTVEEQQRVIRMFHEMKTDKSTARDSSAHYAAGKTHHMIAQKYYWYSMVRDIEQYVKSCKECQSANLKISELKPEVHAISLPSKPMYLVGVDITQLSTKGDYKYVIICIDFYSRWVEAKPLESKSAESVAYFLYEMICRHGCLQIQLNDERYKFSTFVSRILGNLTNNDQYITSDYHPPANESIEKCNATIKAHIIKSLTHYKEKWPLAIDSILFNLRMSKHESTGYSPFEMLYGQKPSLPYQLDTELSFNDVEGMPPTEFL